MLISHVFIYCLFVLPAVLAQYLLLQNERFPNLYFKFLNFSISQTASSKSFTCCIPLSMQRCLRAQSLFTYGHHPHTRLLKLFHSPCARSSFGISFRFYASTPHRLFSADISAPCDMTPAIAFFMFYCTVTVHLFVLLSYCSQKPTTSILIDWETFLSHRLRLFLISPHSG